jgi:hypothetical protein
MISGDVGGKVVVWDLVFEKPVIKVVSLPAEPSNVPQRAAVKEAFASKTKELKSRKVVRINMGTHSALLLFSVFIFFFCLLTPMLFWASSRRKRKCESGRAP